MVNYICKRCGYSCNNKSFIKRHFMRKKLCKPIICDADIHALYEEIFKEKHPNFTKKLDVRQEGQKNVNFSQNVTQMLGKNVENVKKSHFDVTQMLGGDMKISHSNNLDEKIEKNQNNENSFKCRFCNAIFKHRSSRSIHEKDRCAFKIKMNEIDLFKKELEHEREKHKLELESHRLQRQQDRVLIGELKKQIEKLLDKVGNTTYNNQYNIVLNAFGKEDISYINSETVNKLIKNGPMNCIPKLLKHIHFNPKHNENRNVKITNVKKPLAQIYNGHNWEYKDKKETIENMTDKAYNIITEHYSDGNNRYMDTLKDKYDDNDKNLLKQLHKDTELMVLNASKED